MFELGDLTHVTATSETQFPICNIRRLQATQTHPDIISARRCCPFKEGGGAKEDAAPPSSSQARPTTCLRPRPAPFGRGGGGGGGEGSTLRGGLLAHAQGRTGPRRPHFLAFPPPPPRRYPVHPGHLPSRIGAAFAAAAWLIAAPPQGQVRRGSRSGRRRCPAPDPGLPLAPLRSRRRS